MDRQSILGFILIFVMLMVWMWYNAPPPTQPLAQGQAKIQDTVKAPSQPTQPAKQEKQTDPFSKFFAARAHGKDRIITVETDL
ncbi:MAG: hypothetical protein AAB269_02460, partial [Bacteroidota bacterium]